MRHLTSCAVALLVVVTCGADDLTDLIRAVNASFRNIETRTLTILDDTGQPTWVLDADGLRRTTPNPAAADDGLSVKQRSVLKYMVDTLDANSSDPSDRSASTKENIEVLERQVSLATAVGDSYILKQAQRKLAYQKLSLEVYTEVERLRTNYVSLFRAGSFPQCRKRIEEMRDYIKSSKSRLRAKVHGIDEFLYTKGLAAEIKTLDLAMQALDLTVNEMNMIEKIKD